MADSLSELDQLLEGAQDSVGNSTSYANILRFTLTSNEVFVDLYSVTPDPKDLGEQHAERIYRFIMAPGVAKDFATKLLASLNTWEAVHGVNLPLQPADPVQNADE